MSEDLDITATRDRQGCVKCQGDQSEETRASACPRHQDAKCRAESSQTDHSMRQLKPVDRQDTSEPEGLNLRCQRKVVVGTRPERRLQCNQCYYP